MLRISLWLVCCLCWTCIAGGTEPRRGTPDAADRLSRELADKEFGTIEEFRIQRAWPLRYGLPDEKLNRLDGWRLTLGREVYQNHCVGCHGSDGAGDGPKAKEISPTPRDFRRGYFKYQTVRSPFKPSRHDLGETLRLGLPGTRMPAFDKLPQVQREAVVEYVRWLAMRGEFTSMLAKDLRRQFNDPGRTPAAELVEPVEYVRRLVARNWHKAGMASIRGEVHDIKPPVMTEESIARGKALYEGDSFRCSTCHGEDGRGAKKRPDARPDVWGNKQGSYDLTTGQFKGGDGPLDLYLRLVMGIPGIPQHPPYLPVEEKNGIDPNWDLVHYVYHLAGMKPDEARHARRLPPQKDEWEEPGEPPAEDDELPEIVAKGWGSIQGRIVYGGREAPQRKKIKIPVVGSDRTLAEKEELLDESLVVNKENLGLANVAIWLDREQPEGLLPIHKSQLMPDDTPSILAIRSFRFEPHVGIVRVGQTFRVRNDNPVATNVKIESRHPRNFPSHTILPAGHAFQLVFSAEERRPLRVTSVVHPWMSSFQIVKDHPYVAVTDQKGAFAMQHVPAGTWHVRL